MPDTFPRLLSLLSHELRGPIGVMRGYLRLIDQSGEPLSDRSRQAIAAGLRAGDRVAELLDQASLLAHLQLGELKLEFQRVPLTTILRAAIQAVDLPEGSTVSLDVAAIPPVKIEADEGRLRAALATLIATVARVQASAVPVEFTARRGRLAGRNAVRLRIAPRTMSAVKAQEARLDTRRGGFGLQIPIAATIVTAHRGVVRELRHGETNAGLIVLLPVAR